MKELKRNGMVKIEIEDKILGKNGEDGRIEERSSRDD